MKDAAPGDRGESAGGTGENSLVDVRSLANGQPKRRAPTRMVGVSSVVLR